MQGLVKIIDTLLSDTRAVHVSGTGILYIFYRHFECTCTMYSLLYKKKCSNGEKLFTYFYGVL